MVYEHETFHLARSKIALDANGSNAEATAQDFAQRGLVAMSANLRSLAPSQCLRTALDDDSRTIFLVPVADMSHDVAHEIQAKISGTKRHVDSGQLDHDRPHKIRIIDNKPLRDLVATDSSAEATH